MTYKELIQEVWSNWIKEPRDRKKYSIRNKDYTPMNVKKEKFWGRNIPADWEHFGLCVLREDGYFEIFKESDLMFGRPWNACIDYDFEDLGIVVYDDLEKPRPLSLNLIESENWELIEVKDKK